MNDETMKNEKNSGVSDAAVSETPPVHSFLVIFYGSIIERSIESKKKIRDWNLRPKTVSILVTVPIDITFQ